MWQDKKILIYWRQQDLDNFASFFLKEVENATDFLDQLKSYHFINGKNLINYSKQFNKIDFFQKSNKELLDYLKKFEKYYSELALYTYIPVIGGFALEDVISPYLKKRLSKINKQEKYGEYLSILTYFPCKSWARLEEESLWEIAKIIKKGKTINDPVIKNFLRKHVDRFGWQALGYQFLGPVLKSKDFIARLKIILKEGLPDLITSAEMKEKIKQIEKELKIDKKFQRLFRATGVIMYLKEYRDGIYTRSHQYLNLLIKEIMKRFSIPFDVGYYMKLSEFKDLVQGVCLDYNKIKARKKFFLWKCDDKEYYFVNEKAKKVFEKEVGILAAKDKNILELKGTIASPGKVSGIVKIIKNESDINKIKINDVLVAYMTKPSYLPAMRKAIAFVTNEGGITCHAAIVSREMKKPCIIGTKIATKVLRDGDEVEVDANKGVIKIIK